MTTKTEEYLVDASINLRMFCILNLNSKSILFYIYLAVEFYSTTCTKCSKPLQRKGFRVFSYPTGMVTHGRVWSSLDSTILDHTRPKQSSMVGLSKKRDGRLPALGVLTSSHKEFRYEDKRSNKQRCFSRSCRTE